MLDIKSIREQFPILSRRIHGKELAYFDSGATTLKPRQVVERVTQHYLYETSNVHRGIHTLSSEATTQYENAREKVRKFLNAKDVNEIIFTKGTTNGINMVAQSFLKSHLAPGDEILLSELEHHSNIVPWQMAAEKLGFKIRVIPMEPNGEIKIESVRAAMSERTRMIAVASVSNTLGTRLPVEEIGLVAKEFGAYFLIDAAQSMAHESMDVQKLRCDFLVFSGHKLFGPTGIGALFARLEHLQSMDPVEGGGSMIKTVTFEKTTYDEPPQKFEAGTPHIAGAIGMAAAIEFVEELGLDKIKKYEAQILSYATEQIKKVGDIRIIGTAPHKGPILSFLLGTAHPHDVGTLLDEEGIAVRTGHHCTQPIMKKFGIPATVRASFAIYNTSEEVDRFVSSLKRIKGILL